MGSDEDHSEVSPPVKKLPQPSSFNAEIPKRPLSPYIFYSQEVSKRD